VATVLSIVTQALQEIGAYGQGENLAAYNAQVCLLRFQNQLDAWQADQLTLAVNAQLSFTIPGSTQTFTIGPGGDIAAQRPVYIEAMNYVVVGSSPEVETVMAPMNDDQYDALSIKNLTSSYPTQYYYNTSFSTLLGTMFVWPMPTQDVKVYVYAKQGPAVPVALSSTVIGPAGYQDAFIYQLALRLCTPFAMPVPPLLPSMEAEAYARVKRANMQPGLLGVDAALVPTSGGAYNILNDTNTGYYGR
jgi:hypothetical protein